LFVPRDKVAEVEVMAASAAAAWVPGDPERPETRMGPLASLRQRDRARGIVERALEAGARSIPIDVVAPIDEAGAWLAPVVLSDVTPDMEVAREEVFGPVIVIIGYDDLDGAIRMANDSAYGLSGGVWSSDLQRAERVAERLKTGHVALNGAMLDLAAPFGGVKGSGLGREFAGYGLDEFFSPKSITRPAA
jgi:betaine-aldehyde dehydrogenase